MNIDLLDTNEFTLEKDDRPHLSGVNLDMREPLLKEKEEINFIKKKISDEKIHTIFDEKLSTILEKTSNTVSNFWDDYKVNMLESKYEIENYKNFKEEDRNSISHTLHIHLNGLIHYLRKNDNVIYLGIFLVFISVLIYVFNIIR